MEPKVGDVLRHPASGTVCIIQKCYDARDGWPAYDGISVNTDGVWWVWTDGLGRSPRTGGWRPHPDPDSVWAEFVKWELTK